VNRLATELSSLGGTPLLSLRMISLPATGYGTGLDLKQFEAKYLILTQLNLT
jgi:hypothetical protein